MIVRDERRADGVHRLVAVAPHPREGLEVSVLWRQSTAAGAWAVQSVHLSGPEALRVAEVIHQGRWLRDPSSPPTPMPGCEVLHGPHPPPPTRPRRPRKRRMP